MPGCNETVPSSRPTGMRHRHAVSVSRILPAVLAGSLLVPAVLGAAPPAPDTPSDTIDRVGSTLVERVPGAQIAVWKDGAVVAERGYGFADLDSGHPVTAETRFPVFSLAKAWTVTAAARLAEGGKLDPNAPVNALVPEWRDETPITAMQLATHTAGVRHYRDAAEAETPRRCATVAEAVEIFAGDPLLFPPGTRQSYSSWGFVLLSRVLETAAGEPFPALLDRWILEPAGMAGTVHGAASDTARRSLAYDRVDDTHEAIPLDPSCKWGAGGFDSTAGDAVRFYGALLGGDLVGERMRGMILRAAEDGGFDFGGSGRGGAATVAGDADDGIVVAVVVNERSESMDLSELAHQILEEVRE